VTAAAAPVARFPATLQRLYTHAEDAVVEERAECPICYEEGELLPICSQHPDKHLACRKFRDKWRQQGSGSCTLCRAPAQDGSNIQFIQVGLPRFSLKDWPRAWPGKDLPQ
jgi:hypothetical protein